MIYELRVLQSRAGPHGLSGHVPSALLDGNGHGSVCLSTQHKQARALLREKRCTSNLRRRLSRPRRQYAAL
jgi:hypothetical protein